MNEAQLLSLANKRLPNDYWLFGNEILAFDSHIVKAGNFTDYTGKQCIATDSAFDLKTNYPIKLDDEGLMFNGSGSGILGYTSSIHAVNGQIASNWLATNNWTVDFWMKENIASTGTERIGLGFLQSYSNMINPDYTDRIAVGPTGDVPGRIQIWNNQAAPRATTTWNTSPLYGTNWKHLLIDYALNTGRFTFYVNGVTIGNVTWKLQGQTKSQQIGVMFQDYASSHSKQVAIERFRITSGRMFFNDFDLEDLYPYGLY